MLYRVPPLLPACGASPGARTAARRAARQAAGSKPPETTLDCHYLGAAAASPRSLLKWYFVF
jgi:hypothetical protein